MASNGASQGGKLVRALHLFWWDLKQRLQFIVIGSPRCCASAFNDINPQCAQ